MREINKIIIHCSATNSEKYNHEAIKKDHIENRKFDDIAYHFTIDQKCAIKIGRHVEVIGAHCRGYNHDSIGICLLGLDNFTEDQFETCKEFIKILLETFNLGTEDVFAHNFFNPNKTCPNFDIKKVL